MAQRSKLKSAAHKENRETRPHASVSYVRISPYKVRSVLDIVRGKKYSEAVAMLKFTNKSASEIVCKLIESAGANAESNPALGWAKSDLYVAEIFAGQGPSLKRIRAKDHGRAHSILKRTSHITVILDKEANK